MELYEPQLVKVTFPILRGGGGGISASYVHKEPSFFRVPILCIHLFTVGPEAEISGNGKVPKHEICAVFRAALRAFLAQSGRWPISELLCSIEKSKLPHNHLVLAVFWSNVFSCTYLS